MLSGKSYRAKTMYDSIVTMKAFALILMAWLGLGYVFQRQETERKVENFGAFLGSIILSGSQQRQQSPDRQYVPTPQGGAGSGLGLPWFNAPNPYSGSTFKYTPPPSILPEKERNTAKCVSGYNSLGQIVTECESGN